MADNIDEKEFLGRNFINGYWSRRNKLEGIGVLFGNGGALHAWMDNINPWSNVRETIGWIGEVTGDEQISALFAISSLFYALSVACAFRLYG